jgi:hypothetical protein
VRQMRHSPPSLFPWGTQSGDNRFHIGNWWVESGSQLAGRMATGLQRVLFPRVPAPLLLVVNCGRWCGSRKMAAAVPGAPTHAFTHLHPRTPSLAPHPGVLQRRRPAALRFARAARASSFQTAKRSSTTRCR